METWGHALRAVLDRDRYGGRIRGLEWHHIMHRKSYLVHCIVWNQLKSSESNLEFIILSHATHYTGC